LTAPVAGNTVDNMAVEVATVIACIIEFGVRDGRDDDRKRLLTELFVELNSVPGFLSKETFDDVDCPGRRVTISYWTDSDALRGWMRNEAHVRAIDLGKREIFSHYNIKIATIDRETDWTAPSA
jgi:heme-degrading monooxygenase HmoA